MTEEQFKSQNGVRLRHGTALYEDITDETVTLVGLDVLSGEKIRVTGIPWSGLAKWLNGTLIQNALPMLSDSDREFLITGMGPASFAAIAETEED